MATPPVPLSIRLRGLANDLSNIHDSELACFQDEHAAKTRLRAAVAWVKGLAAEMFSAEVMAKGAHFEPALSPGSPRRHTTFFAVTVERSGDMPLGFDIERRALQHWVEDGKTKHGKGWRERLGPVDGVPLRATTPTYRYWVESFAGVHGWEAFTRWANRQGLPVGDTVWPEQVTLEAKSPVDMEMDEIRHKLHQLYVESIEHLRKLQSVKIVPVSFSVEPEAKPKPQPFTLMPGIDPLPLLDALRQSIQRVSLSIMIEGALPGLMTHRSGLQELERKALTLAIHPIMPTSAELP
jgi:hypothetical protein